MNIYKTFILLYKGNYGTKTQRYQLTICPSYFLYSDFIFRDLVLHQISSSLIYLNIWLYNQNSLVHVLYAVLCKNENDQ